MRLPSAPSAQPLQATHLVPHGAGGGGRLHRSALRPPRSQLQPRTGPIPLIQQRLPETRSSETAGLARGYKHQGTGPSELQRSMGVSLPGRPGQGSEVTVEAASCPSEGCLASRAQSVGTPQPSLLPRGRRIQTAAWEEREEASGCTPSLMRPRQGHGLSLRGR